MPYRITHFLGLMFLILTACGEDKVTPRVIEKRIPIDMPDQDDEQISSVRDTAADSETQNDNDSTNNDSTHSSSESPASPTQTPAPQEPLLTEKNSTKYFTSLEKVTYTTHTSTDACPHPKVMRGVNKISKMELKIFTNTPSVPKIGALSLQCESIVPSTKSPQGLTVSLTKCLKKASVLSGNRSFFCDSQEKGVITRIETSHDYYGIEHANVTCCELTSSMASVPNQVKEATIDRRHCAWSDWVPTELESQGCQDYHVATGLEIASIKDHGVERWQKVRVYCCPMN